MESNSNWTKNEDKILKKHYPMIGTKVIQFLDGRTLDAIDHRVRRLGIRYGLFPVGNEGYFDIETTNLNADFAYMLSYSFKTKDMDEIFSSKITKEEIFSGNFDKRLVSDCIKDLRKYKRIYTYYGTKFDIPFLRSRAVFHRLEFVPFGLIQHQDLYYLVKSKFRFSRNRLEGVTEFMGIEGKTKLSGNTWVKATIGDAESLKYILDHNEADVVILEMLHKRIKEYADVNRRSL